MQEKNRIESAWLRRAGRGARLFESEDRGPDKEPLVRDCARTTPTARRYSCFEIVGRKTALLGLGVSATFLLAGAAADELKVGDKAPEFSLEASDGKTYTLEQYKGKSGGCDRLVPQGVHRGLHQGMQVARVRTARRSRTSRSLISPRASTRPRRTPSSPSRSTSTTRS